MKPLNKDIIPQLKDAYKEYEQYEKEISNRTDYVIRKLAELFGTKVSWWDWNNGGGEVDGHFELDMILNDTIQLDGECKKKDMVAIINEGEWEFQWLEFPTRFLYEDFEQELIDGIKKFNDIEVKRKEKEKREQIEKQKNKHKIVEQAKKKLTKEERKALGI